MKTYLPSLDGLRGIAALAVVGSHFENLSAIDLHLQAAGAAVDFFFILSGFVIAQAYEHRLGQGLTWRDYMALRLNRLYPAILGGVIAGLVVTSLAGETLDPGLVAQFLLLPVLAGPAMHGGELFPLNGPQWSLFLELVANGLHALVSRWLTIPVLIAILVLSAAALTVTSLAYGSLDVGWSRANAWGGPPRVAFGFFMGVLLFRLRDRGWKAPKVPYLVICLALAVCLFRWFPQLGGFAARDIAKVLVVLPVLVWLALEADIPSPWAPLARYLGILSYPLYAIHVPLLRGFEVLLGQLFEAPPGAAWWLALGATLMLGAAFERFYDAPIRAWLRLRRAG